MKSTVIKFTEVLKVQKLMDKHCTLPYLLTDSLKGKPMGEPFLLWFGH